MKHQLPLTYLDYATKAFPELDDYVARLFAQAPEGEVSVGLLMLPTYLDYKAAFSHEMSRMAYNVVIAGIKKDVARFGMPDETSMERYVTSALHEMKVALAAKLNFLHSGKLAYFIEPNLTPLLLDTELNVPCEDFRVPASGCMLVFNDGQFSASVREFMQEEVDGSTHTATVFLTMREFEGRSILSITGFECEQVKGRIFPASRSWARDFELVPGKTIEQQLGQLPETMETNPAILGPMSSAECSFDAMRLWRAAANAALYLTSREPDVSEKIVPPKITRFATLPKRQRQALEDQVRSRSRISYFSVGSSILRSEIPAHATSSPEERRQFSHRFRVVGHYRYQAHGPGRADRTRIWIKPHWKGPDAAEVLTRNVVVRSDDYSPGM